MVVGLNRAIPALAVVACQAILGSDYRRESLNLMRCLTGPAHPRLWNILYERKYYAV
jgi:hypothetical protein